LRANTLIAARRRFSAGGLGGQLAAARTLRAAGGGALLRQGGRSGHGYCSAKARSMTKSPGVEVLPSLKPSRLEHLLQVAQHAGAAADHHPVVGRIQRRHAEVLEQLAGLDQLGDAPHALVLLAGDRGVVAQLARDHLADELVVRQLLDQHVVIGQLVDLANAVHQDHRVELLVGVRVADDAHEGRQPGAGRKQVEPLAGQQVVDDQGAGGLVADDDRVAGLDVLQPRGQRAVGHLDA